MQGIINPGSGPVADATEAEAIKNIAHFILDSKLEGVEWMRIPKEDHGGRFTFLLYRLHPDYRCHVVDMPGLSLDRTRYIGEPQNIWDFPRLYVDGSSWVWHYALLSQEDFKKEPQNE